MKKFHVANCPKNLTIFQWLSEKTDMLTAINDIKNDKCSDDIIELPNQLNIEQLISDTKFSLEKFGVNGWKTKQGDSKSYGGLSMVYNPDLIENYDHNQHTLGTSANLPNEFFYGSTANFVEIKNTYFDSYGFRKLAPCIDQTNLKKFIKSFRLSLTRSRIAVLDANFYDKVGEDFLWHKDETIFENLRINIPIETDRTFQFQIENKMPIHLEVGKLYTWDTHLPHRVYSVKKSKKKRVHLVLGFSPWFDYLEDEDAFTINEYFGRKHPFDILLNNLAHPLIGKNV